MDHDSFLQFFAFSNQPWSGTILILGSAMLAVVVIAFATHRSIRSVASAAAGALSRAGGLRGAMADRSAFQALGRGEVTWTPGGVVVSMKRRLSGTEDGDAEAASDALAGRLKSAGFDLRDVEDSGTLEPGNGTPFRTHLVRVAVRDLTLLPELLRVAREAGFAEDLSAGREEITVEDAHREAGARAVRDAVVNIGILADQLAVPRGGLAMVGAEIETAALPPPSGGQLLKIARTRWEKSED